MREVCSVPLHRLTYARACANNMRVVGFTGSGQGMRKDATRERNIYHMEADD